VIVKVGVRSGRWTTRTFWQRRRDSSSLTILHQKEGRTDAELCAAGWRSVVVQGEVYLDEDLQEDRAAAAPWGRLVRDNQ